MFQDDERKVQRLGRAVLGTSERPPAELPNDFNVPAVVPGRFADLFVPPGYRVVRSGVHGPHRALELDLEHETGRTISFSVDMSDFPEQENPWRWLREVIDLEILWSLE